MLRRLSILAIAAVAAVGVGLPAVATAQAPGEALVTVGSPPGPFSQNKQNEPAVAVNESNPTVLAAGVNEEVDMEACNAGTDNTCPFTPGVGVSGVYFSFDSGHSWTQPTYTGWSARSCVGAPGNADPPCQPGVGPIGTLPGYFENGLVSDGDPGVAFGPKPGPNGFSWANGSRLYYSNLTSNFPTTAPAFKGFEAIAVSRTDDVRAAAKRDPRAPGCRRSSFPSSRTPRSRTSPRSGPTTPRAARSSAPCTCAGPLSAVRRRATPPPHRFRWPPHTMAATPGRNGRVSAAANNGQRNPPDGCTIRTDSRGTAYVFGVGTVSSAGKQPFELLSQSANGGQTWSTPATGGRPSHPAGRA